MLWEKTFLCDLRYLQSKKNLCFRPLAGRFCTILFRLNEFCVHRVVQRDEGGLAQALLSPNDQIAVLQFPEDSRGALAAAVELCLYLLQAEVQPDRAVRLGVAVLPENASSVQQQRIEHLGVVADVPQGFVLEKKPWERYIGCRRALRREPCKKFSSDLLYHPSIHFCVD